MFLVHAKCLGFDQDVMPRQSESEWKCPDCRPCSVCKLVQDQDTILLCCQCDTTFHRSCLNLAPLTMPDDHSWICDGCREQCRESGSNSGSGDENQMKTPVKKLPSVDGKPSVVTPNFASVPNFGPWIFGTRQLELKGPPLEWNTTPTPDLSIPDASLWSPDDVHNYFSQKGFHEQASLLRQKVNLVILFTFILKENSFISSFLINNK